MSGIHLPWVLASFKVSGLLQRCGVLCHLALCNVRCMCVCAVVVLWICSTWKYHKASVCGMFTVMWYVMHGLVMLGAGPC